jgi:D-glycero-D-manno-heptose 1,7-bisphosphate phosphatase
VAEYTRVCPCRKPSPHFLFLARDRYGVDLARSWMIGDRDTDIACGRAGGTRTIGIALDAGEGRPPPAGADYIAENLLAAARIVVAHRR